MENIFTNSIVFSEEYSNVVKRRDFIRGKVIDAIFDIQAEKGSILNELVDVRDPEQIIAYLYLTLRDKKNFCES